jgi:fibro-slime domain-containing protein
LNPNFFDRGNDGKENKYGKTVIHGLDGKAGELNRANISFSDSNNDITTTGFGGIIFNNWCYHSDTKGRLRLTYVNHLDLDERKHKEGKFAFRMTNIPNRTIEGRNNKQVHIEYDTDKVDKYFEKLIENDYIMHLGPLRFKTFKGDNLIYEKVSVNVGRKTFKQAKEMCDKNTNYIGFDIARLDNNGTYDTYMWKNTEDNTNLPVIPDPILGNKLNNNGVRSFEKIKRPNYEEPDICSLNKLQLDKFIKKYKPKFIDMGSHSGFNSMTNKRKDLNYSTHHDPLTIILDVSSSDYTTYHQGIFSKYGYDIGINLAYGYIIPYAGYTGFDSFKNSNWQKLPKLENNKQYTIAVSWNSQTTNTNNRNNAGDNNYNGKCRISILVVEKKSGDSQSFSYISNSVFGVSGDKKNTAQYNVGIQAAGPACNCNPFRGTISNIKIYNALLDTSCLRERQYSGYINGINFARDFSIYKEDEKSKEKKIFFDPAWTAPFKDIRYHFTTYYKPDESGTYKFTVNVDDNCQIFINESLIYSEEGLKTPTEKMETEMNMQKNQLYKFDIYYAERHSAEVLEIKYKKPNDNTVYYFPYLNDMKEYSGSKVYEKDIEKKLFSGYPQEVRLGPTVRRIYKTYRIRYNIEGALNVAPSLGRPSGHSDGKFYWQQNEYPVGYTFIKKTSIDYPLGYDDAGEHALEPVSNKFNIFSNYQLYDNVDFLGGDYRDYDAGNEDNCLERCQKESQCNGMTYRKGDGHCWLKTLNGARRVDNRPDLKSYLKITNN